MIDMMAGKRPWMPATAGEQLLFMLLEHHQECRHLAETLQAAKLGFGRRFADLSNFFMGASILHLQQRLLRLAHDVREQSPYDRQEQMTELRAKVCDVIELTPIVYDGNFGELIEQILVSAEQMHREPSTNLKKHVIANGPPACYSCGRLFGAVTVDEPDGLQPTADHVWPRALGGDTIEENLLPACGSCNSAKGHIAAWQMAWIQPIVFADIDEENGLKSLQREAKIALHIRAAMGYAQQSGTTLRDAFLAIGPRERPIRIDAKQGYDFFNLRVHDAVRTNVDWTPA